MTAPWGCAAFRGSTCRTPFSELASDGSAEHCHGPPEQPGQVRGPLFLGPSRRPLLCWEGAFLHRASAGEISFPICVLLIKRNTLGEVRQTAASD